jgi:hypothetical protein
MGRNVALTGDFAGLNGLIKRIEKIGKPAALERLSDNLAEQALDLIEEGFANERDPYGKPWAPKVFGDGRQILVGKSTQLRRGFHRKVVASTGFRVGPSATAKYAKWIQSGTGLYGPRKQKIRPINAKALIFYAEGFISLKVASSLRKYMSSAFAVNPRAAKKVFKRELGKGSKMFVRTVKGMKPRKMVPEKGNLPASWGEAMRDIAEKWFESEFAKGGRK